MVVDPQEDSKNEGTIITWTPEKLSRFKRVYERSIEENPRFGDRGIFEFEGNVFVRGYAKYLIEYLEQRLKEE